MIFDMDGVIVDSMPFHSRAWEAYLERMGMDAGLLNQRMHGKHNDELLREFLGEDAKPEDIRRMGAEKEALYREMIHGDLERQLLPGLREFLARFAAWPKAVASNAEAANVEFVLREAALGGHFGVVLDGQQVERGKPDPEIYLKAASLLRIEPGNCIVFEDSQTGIDAARSAGMTVVAINSHRTSLSGQAVEADDFLDLRLCKWLDEYLTARR